MGEPRGETKTVIGTGGEDRRGKVLGWRFWLLGGGGGAGCAFTCLGHHPRARPVGGSAMISRPYGGGLRVAARSSDGSVGATGSF